jgi:hypothetical protein
VERPLKRTAGGSPLDNEREHVPNRDLSAFDRELADAQYAVAAITKQRDLDA